MTNWSYSKIIVTAVIVGISLSIGYFVYADNQENNRTIQQNQLNAQKKQLEELQKQTKAAQDQALAQQEQLKKQQTTTQPKQQTQPQNTYHPDPVPPRQSLVEKPDPTSHVEMVTPPKTTNCYYSPQLQRTTCYSN